MSRPRTPYGPNPPGRLAGTMIKVLAAELSDQGRLSRGKRLWADHAVIDIVIGHGSVTAEVQGSRQEPYVVTVEADAGDGVPTRRELWIRCTCPDDTGTGSEACKHAVATMFALSDEIAIEPELIQRWRTGGRRDAVTQLADRRAIPPETDDDGNDDDADDDRPDAQVIQLRPDRREDPDRDGHDTDEPDDEPDPVFDEIAHLLRSPGGAGPPVFSEPSRLDHGPIRDRKLAEILNDALDHLAIRWE